MFRSIIAVTLYLLSGHSLLHASDEAAMLNSIVENDLQRFKQLIEDGYDVNSFMDHEDGYWLMCEVARPGRFELLKHAINVGGDIDLVKPGMSQSYASPLMCAISHGNKQVFDYLLTLGADPNIVVCPECAVNHQNSPIQEALISDEFQMAYELIPITKMTKRELEGIRFSVEDFRYFPPQGESQEEYRLKLASYLEGKGYSLNIWTLEKENSGEWVTARKRKK